MQNKVSMRFIGSVARALSVLTVVFSATATADDTLIGFHPQGCTAPSLKVPTWTDAQGWDDPEYQLTIELADVAGDPRAELIGRDFMGVGVHSYEIDTDRGWWGAWLPRFGSESRTEDLSTPRWASPDRYRTIRYADLDGDGVDEMVAHDNGADGVGLIAFEYESDGGAGSIDGNWVPLNTGFSLIIGTDWSKPEYYETFRVGKLLPGDAEQLVVRSKQGMIGIRWNPSAGDFELFSELPEEDHFADEFGWNQRLYFSSLHLADIDGDGLDEVTGRGRDGLYALKPNAAQTGWDIVARPSASLNLSDAIVNRDYYVESMTWGRFLEDPHDLLVIRVDVGVLMVAWNTPNQSWLDVSTTPRLLPGGGAVEDLDTSFRASDLDGDGVDELHFVNLFDGGLRSYRSNPDRTWAVVNTGNDDTEEILFGDGRTIRFGDIDGDGWLEAIGRSAQGLETYFYDPSTERWEENFSCGFPEFPGNETNAYAAMNRERFAGATEFRHEYNDPGNNQSNRQWLELNTMRPNDGDDSYDQDDWNAVRNQLLREVDQATSALNVFEDQRLTFDEQYTSEWESMDTVGNALLAKVEAQQGITVEFVLEELVQAGVKFAFSAVARGAFPDKLVARLLITGAGQILGAGAQELVKDLFPMEPTSATIDTFKDQLLDKRQSAVAQLKIWARDVTGFHAAGTSVEGDLGTMAAVATLHQRNYWPASFSGAPFVADRARWGFKRWLYQQVLASVYDLHIYDCDLICPEPSPSRIRACYDTANRPVTPSPDSRCENAVLYQDVSWVYIAIEKKGWAQSDTLPQDVINTITDKPSTSCQTEGGYFVDQCNLGLEMESLLQRLNGWRFNVVNQSVFVDDNGVPKESYSCAGLDATIVGTNGPDILVGTDGPDVIVALDGDDLVYALGGNDVVCSGRGNDRVFGDAGDDLLILGAGNDQAFGGQGDDAVLGETGDDMMFGGRGNDSIWGGLGADILVGGADDDFVHGGQPEQFDRCAGEESVNCDRQGKIANRPG